MVSLEAVVVVVAHIFQAQILELHRAAQAVAGMGLKHSIQA
jgi:hypothetical protein